MNINFGLMPDINFTATIQNKKKYLKGREKKKIQAYNALNSFKKWVEEINI